MAKVLQLEIGGEKHGFKLMKMGRDQGCMHRAVWGQKKNIFRTESKAELKHHSTAIPNGKYCGENRGGALGRGGVNNKGPLGQRRGKKNSGKVGVE